MTDGFKELIGFNWDDGNRLKNVSKHKVSNAESEQVFFNKPIIVLQALLEKSNDELRYQALGSTDNKRYLSVIFTIRKQYIRVISSRPMNAKERLFYDKTTKKNP